MEDLNISALLGKVVSAIDKTTEEIKFTCTDGSVYKMYHNQNCCENVWVEDIAGDLQDLIGNPILMAEESTSNENPEGVTMESQDSYTWTFYKLATIKGYVTIRWYGESNGYYSESVEFVKL
jgi:uncharacterized protein YegJ (DUF2314 family)